MGSATTQSLVANAQAVATATVDIDTARELFAASSAVADSTALSGALADDAVPAATRAQLVDRVFASLAPTTRSLIAAAASQRWSSAQDFAAGIEELAVRVTARAESADIEAELFQVSRVVGSDSELELALGSRLAEPQRKGDLIEKVLGQSVSTGTLLIVSSLVRQSRGRRVRALLARATSIVASQRGRLVATVTSAAPLTAAQTARLETLLSSRYGGTVSVNTVIDSAVLGGLRIQIADDVIDGSISSRLADLRQRLAG